MENKNNGLNWIGQKDTDWVSGDIPAQNLNVYWPAFISDPEVQYDQQFDTYSCASFSLTNVIETQLNALLSVGALNLLLPKFNNLGVISNGKFNFSDRFVAVGSGTKPLEGNSMQTVIDFVRKNGLVSENACPFLQTMNQTDYFSPLKPSLFLLAKKMKWAIDIAYEWTITDQTNPQDRLSVAKNALQHAPLWCAIPICPTYKETVAQTCNITKPAHCVECYKVDDVFKILDQYIPFNKQLASDYPVLWAMKVVVTPKLPITLSRNLFFGCFGDDVKSLQTFLGVNPTGWFGPATRAAVKEYQLDMGIPSTGYVGNLTRASLSS